MMNNEYTWLAVSPVDGHIIAELPTVQCSSLEIRMMEGTSATATIPWQSLTMSNWETATAPFASCLLLINMRNPETALWGGIILSRERNLGEATLTLKLGTWEHILKKYPVGDDTYTNTDQNMIVANLTRNWAINGQNNSLLIDAAASSRKRDDTDHKLSDNKSVLSCIQALSNLNNGPEWYIDWQKTGNNYHPVLHISDHIGSSTPRFTFGEETLAEFTINEAWEDGYAANKIQAYSTANNTDENAEQPQSNWYTYTDPNRPILPYRYQPSTSITQKETLNQHAAAKLNSLKNGTTTITIKFALATMPRFGIDWSLGDVIAWDIQAGAENQLGKYVKGQVRFIGYTIDLSSSTFTPYLQDEGEI